MKTIQLFEKQLKFYLLEDREALLEAGIAYGKSRVASLWLCEQTQLYPGTKWFMIARDYGQLSSAVDAEFEAYINDELGVQKNKHYTKTNGSPIHYQFKNGSQIFGVSAINYESAFRSGSYSGAWGDEVDFWKPEAVERLRGRIRAYPEKIRFTSSPRGYNHVYKDFHVNKMGPVINATTLENPTLSQEYKESLRLSYSTRLYAQEVLAQRLNITEGAIYFDFNRERNVKSVKYNPGYPIWFGCDFNNNPLTAVLGQVIGDHLFIFEEYYNESGQAKTENMAKTILNKYGKCNAVPDSTGIKNTTNASLSDIAILKQFHQVHAAHNPFRIDRYNAVNTRLEQGRIVIDPSCTYTIRDLEQLSYKPNSDMPDVSANLGHISDALGYLVWKTINPFKQKTTQAIEIM